MAEARDDSLMNRFDENGLRRFRARDAIVAVTLVAVVLVLFEGTAIRRAGEQMNPGIGRSLVLAVGKPAGWLADRLPLADWADRATAWLSPDAELDASAAFDDAGPARGGRAAPVTADAFDPAALGDKPPPRRPLRTLLVTGDSLSTPLDTQLARRLADHDVRVIRDPHLGTGISKSFVVDWGQLSASQVKRFHPDAVVMFVGANEGFPMPGPGGRDVKCCGPEWAAAYANRLRRVGDTFRQGGAANVYWVALPSLRDPDRDRIRRVVNAALDVAVQPWRAQIRVIETAPTFTPDGYRDAMPVDGRETIVREADGIHLNEVGARLLADMVLRAIARDRTY
jgi:lysophospholipase L1-like esterase